MFKLGLAKSIHHARVLIRQRHIRVRKQVTKGAIFDSFFPAEIMGNGKLKKLKCFKPTKQMLKLFISEVTEVFFFKLDNII